MRQSECEAVDAQDLKSHPIAALALDLIAEAHPLKYDDRSMWMLGRSLSSCGRAEELEVAREALMLVASFFEFQEPGSKAADQIADLVRQVVRAN